MPRITVDELALLKDRFETFIDNLLGQDVITRINPDVFTIEVLRKPARAPVVRPQLQEDIGA